MAASDHDGFLLQIKAPSHVECGNAPAYNSGHYCCYGISVQAMCDSECHLLFYSLAAPGKKNDARAIRKTSLLKWIEFNYCASYWTLFWTRMFLGEKQCF
jgi:hypothetical protein